MRPRRSIACGLRTASGRSCWPPAARAVRQPRRALRGADAVARVYTAILDADFERAEQLDRRGLSADADTKPAQVLDATRLLWTHPARSRTDPPRRRLHRRGRRARSTPTDAWTRREPKSAEAWFYVGGAYGARVQCRVLRGQTRGRGARRQTDQARARTGARCSIRRSTTRSSGWGCTGPTPTSRRPARRCCAGCCCCRAAIATRAAPDAAGAQREGALLADEAAYQLHLVFLWYENKSAEGLALLRGARARSSGNPLFQRLVADVLDTYVHDIDRRRSRPIARCSTRADRQGRRAATLAEAEARLGLAASARHARRDRSRARRLTQILARDPTEPWAPQPRRDCCSRAAYDRVGARQGRRRSYRRGDRAPPARDPAAASRCARGAPASGARRDRRRREPIASSLAAWRAFDAATRPRRRSDASSERSRSIRRTRSRAIATARVLMARHRDAARARASSTRRCARRRCVAAADARGSGARRRRRCTSSAHDRARAIDLYRRAASIFGASAETQVERAHTRVRRKLRADRHRSTLTRSPILASSSAARFDRPAMLLSRRVDRTLFLRASRW